MNRRNALRSIGVTTAGVLAYSSCTSVVEISYPNLPIKSKDAQLITLVSLVILPENPLDFPTIETREVFILEWIDQVFDKEQIKAFIESMNAFKNEVGDSFNSISMEEQLNTLRAIIETDSKAVDFIQTVKSISIRHFTTSQTYLTDYVHFEFIPGRYEGCTSRTQL